VKSLYNNGKVSFEKAGMLGFGGRKSRKASKKSRRKTSRRMPFMFGGSETTIPIFNKQRILPKTAKGNELSEEQRDTLISIMKAASETDPNKN
jgi:hypothetical protein